MTPHARMVTAIDALITRRSMDPLAAIPVVSTEEFLALVTEEEPARAPDWIDARMNASVAWFAHPLTTRPARRLYAARLRRREVAHG